MSVTDDKCGEKRTIKILDVLVLDIECQRAHWHTTARSFMLHRHYWSGEIDGVWMTVKWGEEH